MPFEVREGVVALKGACTIEEAEALHEAVRDLGDARFDLSGTSYMHTAIVQVILASGGTLAARPAEVDPVLGACLDTLRPA
ncbi:MULTISPECIES: hypothetical protein [unclassified Aureimonas]|uniref:hypothetical protein n=1 Tax=unclassified Aureimonas TaxID=2615206 RepID=UPI0006F66FD1|nr:MULTISPECIES: hypothetical protein [unclassified Aureimonas]KQT69073.1 hypothetical protein ASG54_05345 [Aureimonas sp. Leaf460]KQT69311.1 hypothetical protein ASG62_17950 [Aureimonas sp. Leaf427]